MFVVFFLDGVEEVFAVVGESLSLSCSSTSSLRAVDKLQWYRGKLLVNHDSSMVIKKVSSLHSGDYQCLDDGNVTNQVRLHTLDSEC